ncbi:MAG TPA: lipopolysaccharide heptosyltransferase II [bacterium]|nr:lipopolysaccharide heptosyltransferase II [bacterium]
MDAPSRSIERPGSILIVSKNWLGDAVCVTPAIRAIKEAFPSSQVSVLTHPRCADVYLHNPFVDHIVRFHERRGVAAFFSLLRLWLLMISGRYDTVFLFHRSRSKALVAALAGIGNRIGFDTKGRGIFLTVRAAQPDAGVHMIDHHLRLLEECGIPARGRAPVYAVVDEEMTAARLLLSGLGLGDGERYIVINPGGNWERKRWPCERFAGLADRLAAAHPCRIVITGGEQDRATAGAIAGLMRTQPVIAAGRTDLRTLGAVLAGAALYIGNDSGPTHIAAAVGVPVIALFGPTDPALTGPAGRGSIRVISRSAGCPVPCYNAGCVDYRCIRAVSEEDVLEAARRILHEYAGA